MTAKIIVTLGGAVGASEIDYTAKAPFFEAGEGESSQWSFETTFANGDDGQGEFVVDNDDGSIPEGTIGGTSLASKNPVRLTEDASGTDYTLVYGRILEKDVIRNDDYPIADASQYRVTVQAPGDLALMKLTEDWVRPVETDYQRLVALQAYLLNGSASTAAKVWNTVDVTVDATHFTPNTNTVSMPAHIYQAGTALDEIIEDIRTMAGKTWGIVPHHVDGVGSHKCLQFVVENDNTTNPCTIKISDDLADLDPDGLSGPPVIAPQWGAPRHEEGEQQTFGLVVRYGPDDKYVYVEGPHIASDIASYDRAVDTIYDDQSENAAQAMARGLALIDYKRFEHVTHTVILKVRADHAHLIAPGMSIDIKSSAAMSGAYLHTWQTRRIASVQYEPLAPEAGGDLAYYQLTLELDRRLLREPPPRSNAKPGPQPPSGSCTDLTGGAELDTFAEHNTTGHWCSNSNFIDYSDGSSAIGSWHVGFGGVLSPENNYMVYTFTGTFTAGHNYKFGFYYRSDKTEAATCYFGASDTGCAPGVGISCFTGDKVSLSITPDGTWQHYEMTWTPSTTIVSDGANTTAVAVRWGVDATGSADGVVLADGGTLEDCNDAEPPPAADDGTGSVGDNCTDYACADHKHPVQTAGVTPITDTGGYYTSGNVEGALQEIGAAGGTPYTDEDAQDAVGTILTDSSTVDFTYTATPTITAAVIPGGIKLDDLGAPDDNTDLNASTSKHGLLPKLSGTATEYLDGSGAWSTPAGDGGGGSLTVEEVDGSPTDSAVTKLVFPNGTLGITSHVATYTPSAAAGASPFYLDTLDLDATYGDEFDGSSLDAKWTRLGIDAGTEEFVAGSWMRLNRNTTVPSGGEGYLQTPASFPTYMEIIWSGSYESDTSTGGSPQAGPFMVTSAGAGLAGAINPQGNYFRLATLSSGAPTGGNTLTRSPIGGVIAGGMKHWVRLIRLVGDGATQFFAQYSLDGNTWSGQVSAVDSTAVTKIGFGRLVGITTASETLSTDRFNAVPLTLGNNLCRTPTSGTATYTASSSFSGFSPASAFDGNHGTDWASNGYSAGQYIQCAWSVAQTINTIVLRCRTSDTWAYGKIEFSDGSTVPTGYLSSVTQNAVVIRLPSNKSTTLLKVISISGGGTNPGFREIEAYNAS